MKVAALYDVHGMPWALEAVLRELGGERFDGVVFGGDLVAGPFPVETLALARSVPDATFVRGNAEREPDERLVAKLGAAECDEQRRWPATVAIDGVLYCHATPESDEVIITDASSDEKIAALLEGVDARLVVGGHTHMQQQRGAYVNAGSVGMPYEGEVAAFWLVVDDGEPSFRRTGFDVDAAIDTLSASDWPGAAGFVEENLRRAVTRDEAVAVFGG
ncbi:MAG TPA: metallophosphoesterase family protein [Gaiellaceae bacterium]|nr:metallophosphoesterase family protein [Gaiellaceae bacterium]